MNQEHFNELLYQALETERGGVQVYETALRCAVNKDLKEELEKYHEQTKRHVEIVESLFEPAGLNPEEETPGAKIVKMKGEALVKAMETTLKGGEKEAAQLVAVECVVDAETKDHQNWELLSQASKEAPEELSKALRDACMEVEEQEDKHLYHMMGWTRELWMESLGLPAVLPPPEERKHVNSAIAAAKAKNQRTRMVHHREHARSR